MPGKWTYKKNAGIQSGGMDGDNPTPNLFYDRPQDARSSRALHPSREGNNPTLQKRGSRFCFLFSVYSDYVAFIIASRCLSLQAKFI